MSVTQTAKLAVTSASSSRAPRAIDRRGLRRVPNDPGLTDALGHRTLLKKPDFTEYEKLSNVRVLLPSQRSQLRSAFANGGATPAAPIIHHLDVAVPFQPNDLDGVFSLGKKKNATSYSNNKTPYCLLVCDGLNFAAFHGGFAYQHHWYAGRNLQEKLEIYPEMNAGLISDDEKIRWLCDLRGLPCSEAQIEATKAELSAVRPGQLYKFSVPKVFKGGHYNKVCLVYFVAPPGSDKLAVDGCPCTSCRDGIPVPDLADPLPQGPAGDADGDGDGDGQPVFLIPDDSQQVDQDANFSALIATAPMYSHPVPGQPSGALEMPFSEREIEEELDEFTRPEAPITPSPSMLRDHVDSSASSRSSESHVPRSPNSDTESFIAGEGVFDSDNVSFDEEDSDLDSVPLSPSGPKRCRTKRSSPDLLPADAPSSSKRPRRGLAAPVPNTAAPTTTVPDPFSVWSANDLLSAS